MPLNEEDKYLAEKIFSGDTEAENFFFTRFKEKIQLLVRIRLRKKIPIEDQEDLVSDRFFRSVKKGPYLHQAAKRFRCGRGRCCPRHR